MNTEMFYGASPIVFEKAKYLRNKMTESEQLLWQELSDNKILGFKFRRQHPIFSFIVDFYCHPAKLVIEIDGEYHSENDQSTYDIARTDELERFGLKVIRFTNEKVKNNIQEVLDEIRKTLMNCLK